MSANLADYIADAKRKIDAVPSGETKARLQLRLGRVATDLARQITDAAEAKRRKSR